MNVMPDRLLCLGLALFITVLNACKPPVIDDPTFLAYAGEFAAHPLHPYGFDYYGKPANDNLAPPVLPAWLAVGIGLFGRDPFTLKLWLFPILLLFVAALQALLRRFAAGMEKTFLILTVLSPPLLPSINIMLDIPVLAFGMAALELYLRGVERASFRGVLLAGLLAGIAMETKYTAFTLPAVFLLHALLTGRYRAALAAAFAACLVFASCELYLALADGDSHFLLGLRDRGRRQNRFLLPRLLSAQVTLFGGLAPILGLIGLTALGLSRRWVLALLALVIVGFAALLVVPERDATLLRYADSDRPLLILNHLLFIPPGLIFLATVGLVARSLYRDEATVSARFLVGWLIVETVGYLGISPFPTVRRILGLFVVSTFLIARLAARKCISSEQRRTIALLTPFGVLLGLGYYAIELRDALAEREAFEGALRFVREQEPSARVYFYGPWGFQYHGEAAGLRWAREVGEDLQPGDWFLHDPRDATPISPRVAGALVLMKRITVEDRFPIATQRTFYESRTPIVHHEGPHAEVLVYRYGSGESDKTE